MLKSFFLNESGFVAPWTALSWSWISGILVGAATLLGAVTPALADVKCSKTCCGSYWIVTCHGYDDCGIECGDCSNVLITAWCS